MFVGAGVGGGYHAFGCDVVVMYAIADIGNVGVGYVTDDGVDAASVGIVCVVGGYGVDSGVVAGYRDVDVRRVTHADVGCGVDVSDRVLLAV